MYLSININLPPIKGYISEAVQDRRLIVLITNRKSHVTFRLVHNRWPWITLNGVMVKLQPKYGDFSIFQDGSHRHLGFSNFENFNVGTLNMAKLRQCAKFCRNRSNRVRDMVIFRFYKMAVAAMLDFQIFVNFNNRNVQEGQTASSCQISSKSVTCKTVKIALNLS